MPANSSYYSAMTNTDNALFIGTYQVPKLFVKKSNEFNYGSHRRFRLQGEIVIKLYVV